MRRSLTMLAQPLRLITRGCAGEASPSTASAASAAAARVSHRPVTNNNRRLLHNRTLPSSWSAAPRRGAWAHRHSHGTRPYHSRWAVSVYGKDPSIPPEDYEGYEKELAEFEEHGSHHYKNLQRKPGDGILSEREKREAIRARRRAAESRGDDAGGDALGNLGLEWEDEEDLLHDDDRDTAVHLRSDEEDDAGPFIDKDEEGRTLHTQLPGGIGARALALGYNPRTVEDPVLDPGLYLVGTPIGNLEDITLRALRVLRSADAVLCEDTRHTRRLLARYAIEPLKLVSYHAHNERRRREPLLDKMRMGLALALVSDAGTPGVADPGADLAAACAEEGIAVHPIPGPSAAAAAVAMAGIPVDEGFTFVGFLPPKSGARRKKLEKLKPIAGSLVAFVPPHKLVSTLTDAAEVLGDRNCCVCREMTKVRTTTVYLPSTFVGVLVFILWFFFPGERAAMIMQTMCRETARLEPRISRTPLGFIQTLAWWRRLAAMRTKHTTKA